MYSHASACLPALPCHMNHPLFIIVETKRKFVILCVLKLWWVFSLSSSFYFQQPTPRYFAIVLLHSHWNCLIIDSRREQLSERAVFNLDSTTTNSHVIWRHCLANEKNHENSFFFSCILLAINTRHVYQRWSSRFFYLSGRFTPSTSPVLVLIKNIQKTTIQVLRSRFDF